MSYAAAARSHIDELPPPPAPDPSLLEGTHTHAASAGDQEEEPHGNVHGECLRQTQMPVSAVVVVVAQALTHFFVGCFASQLSTRRKHAK